MGTEYISAWAAVISAFSALIGILITAWIARRTILGPMRLEWITTLRVHVTELSAEAMIINRDFNSRGIDKLSDNIRKNLVLQEHRIRLLLNPDEEKHQHLLASVHRVVEACLTTNLTQFQEIVEDVFQVAQPVLRAEWKKVKNLQ